MPSEQQLIEALRRADAAGDSAAAGRFAELIKQGRAGGGQQAAAPAEQGALSPLASLVHGAARVVPFARQAGAAMEAAIPGLRPGGFGERYAAIRAENEGVADQNPGMARTGAGLGIAGQVAMSGGASLLKDPRALIQMIRSGAASVPAALRAAFTPAGLQAAARVAPAGAVAGLGLGNADIPLAQGQGRAALQQGLGEAATGAGLAAGAGLLGHAAGQRNAAALAAEQARRAPVEANIATEAAGVQTAAANKVSQAQFKADLAAAKGQNRQIAEQHMAATQAAKDAAKQRTTQLQQAALARAQAPLESRSLETLGLDSARGRSMLGGPLQAAEKAPQLARTPIPELGTTYGDLAAQYSREPLKHAQVIRELRQTVGQRIGAVREALAGRKITAGVPTTPILQRLEQTLTKGENTRQSVQDAVGAVRSMLDDVTKPSVGVQILGPNGQPIRSAGADKLTPGQLRKFIEDLEDQIGFKPGAGGTTLQQALGDRADGVLLAARDAAVKAEQGLVATYEPTRLAQYLDDTGRYRTLKIVEHGAETKLARPEGRSIRRPAPDKVQPVQPVLPQRPAAVPLPTRPTPQPVPKVTADQRAAEAVVRREGKPGIAGAALRTAGAGVGSAVGGALGGYPGAFIGAETGRSIAGAAAKRFLSTVRPSRSAFLASSDKVLAQLQRYAPVIEAAERAGPRAAVAIHRALIARDPAYADAFNEESRRAPPQDWNEFSAAWKARPQVR